MPQQRARSRISQFPKALLPLLLVFGGCSTYRVSPNVLLISLDTLRADHLSCYGYHRQTSPFLDETARRGVRFENFFVNTYATPQSHATILSGQYQEVHQVGYSKLRRRHRPAAQRSPKRRRGGGNRPPTRLPLKKTRPELPAFTTPNAALPADLLLLPQILSALGYYTIAVTEGGFMSGNLGFSRGFTEFFDESSGPEMGAAKLLALLRDSGDGSQPVFAMFHTYEIHAPFYPPEKYTSLFGEFESDLDLSGRRLGRLKNRASELADEDLAFMRAMYDAEIRYTDDVLRQLISELETMGFLENCLVVITSDHGEALGEHNHLLHGIASLYDEIIRVPLILFGNGVQEGRVDDRMASSVDIVPTIMSYVGLRAESSFPGTDLLALAETPEDEQVIFSQFGNRLYSIRSRAWKLIEDRESETVELFQLSRDPHETKNRAAEFPAVQTKLQTRLEQWKKDVRKQELSPSNTIFTEEQVKKLKSLGYLHPSDPSTTPTETGGGSDVDRVGDSKSPRQ